MEQETPPRAWGRQAECQQKHAHARNTPTSVGKTRILRSCTNGQRKHPHERGEDLGSSDISVFDTETPPRAWGRLAGEGEQVVQGGNTPTSVGKTPADAPDVAVCGKHPHERGEDPSPLPSHRSLSETPPRAWGRLDLGTVQPGILRNTPTSVGKTTSQSSKFTNTWKHPHERGEDSVILLDFITQKIGSILVANELQAIQ